MRKGYGNRRAWLFGSLLAVALPAFAQSGYASAETHEQVTHRTVQTAHQARQAHQAAVNHMTHAAVHLAAARGHLIRSRVRIAGISCVPYARNASGITLAGNAWQWWDHADGAYARGGVPEPGSVLAFRANGRMRLGHVAVVSRVVNNREIEIDHANWAGGGVAHGVPVVDVSENNDWTAVRVGLGSATSFGSIYPTYGFIYDRPDSGTMLTAITTPAVQPALNPAPRDLRPAPERLAPGPRMMTAATLPDRKAVTADTLNAREYEEVAEAPAHPAADHGGGPAVDRQ